MCIVIVSSCHPDYPFILASNRDEYLSRPTAAASWWTDHPHVLGGRDLQRPTRGTWLGITRSGRIAALTNFREAGVNPASKLSRGEIIKNFLTHETDESAELGAARILNQQSQLDSVGGFSLLVGKLRKPRSDGSRQPMVVVSNRSKRVDDIPRLMHGAGQVHGLSNTLFSDLTWPKVTSGKRLLQEAIVEHAAGANSDKEKLLKAVFEVLSTDSLPRNQTGETWETQITKLRDSIFIPRLGYDDAEALPADRIAAATSTQQMAVRPDADMIYGTQKQTVILVDNVGRVTFVERTLFDQDARDLSIDDAEFQSRHEFTIEDWDSDD